MNIPFSNPFTQNLFYQILLSMKKEEKNNDNLGSVKKHMGYMSLPIYARIPSIKLML
jgi:hypothetical protein